MPEISVVIPCYNEARYLPETLRALSLQTRAADEIVLVDGGSTDGTVSIARGLADAFGLPLRILHNPARYIPHALNLGIDAARGSHIARLDGHARPAPDYLETCLEVWQASDAALVGGVWEVVPGADTAMAEAIAIAGRTPLGSGGAAYRSGTATAQDVDTVPFGFFERQLWASVGRYDETLLTNEDYEFAARIRKQGGRVRFDPRIRCTYFARADLRALARQYWRYGWWKSRMLRRNPRELRPRQVAPALVGVGSLAAFGGAMARREARPFAGLYFGLYGALLMVEAGRRSGFRPGIWARLIGAYAVMHHAWGLGALAGTVFGGFGRNGRTRTV